MNATRDHKKVNKNMTTILYRLEVLERQQTQLIDRIRIDMTARATRSKQSSANFSIQRICEDNSPINFPNLLHP